MAQSMLMGWGIAVLTRTAIAVVSGWERALQKAAADGRSSFEPAVVSALKTLPGRAQCCHPYSNRPVIHCYSNCKIVQVFIFVPETPGS